MIMINNILICGAKSFVATGYSQMLTDMGYGVDSFSRGNVSGRNGRVVTGKYLDIDKNQYLKNNYYAVINFAILKDQSIEENIAYVKALIEVCKVKNVKKLIHFSSIMVYNYHLGYVDENSPIETKEHTMMEGYGKIKIAVDEYINSVKEFLPFEIIIVRPGYVLADNRPAPFIKRLPAGISIILGNRKSKQPIVKREDIHLALCRIIETDKNLPVYHLFQNNNITKYAFAKEIIGGIILTLPKIVFEGIPRLLMKMGIMKKSLYSRFDGMYNYNVVSSALTEEKLNITFK